MQTRLSNGLIMAALGHLAIEFSSNFLPILYPLLMVHMGLNFTQVGTIALVATTATTLAQPFFGYLSDRWGSERMASLSIIWIGVVMGLVGFAWNYPSLLFLIALGALGSAAFHPAAAVLAASHSGPRRGAGLSIFSVGGNIGSALSPLWMATALGLFGMAGTATLMPIGLLAGILAYRLLRPTPSARQKQGADRGHAAADGFLLGLILVVVAVMFRSWFQVALTTYLPVWIDQAGGGVAVGGRYLSVLLFAISVGSFVGGPAGDRLGLWQVVALSLAAMAPALWLFLNTQGVLQLVWLAVVGITIGATFPTSIALALDAWPRQAGVASGLLMGLGWLPGGLGASLTGMVADRFSLTVGLNLLLVPPVLGLGCILAYALARRFHLRAGKIQRIFFPSNHV